MLVTVCCFGQDGSDSMEPSFTLVIGTFQPLIGRRSVCLESKRVTQKLAITSNVLIQIMKEK